MLTKRQNLLETIRGGKPDRYVNQYEALAMVVMNPYMAHNPAAEYGKGPLKNAWGVTNVWPEGTPGGFPVHDEEHIVCKDITHWRDYVHAPSLDYSDALTLTGTFCQRSGKDRPERVFRYPVCRSRNL